MCLDHAKGVARKGAGTGTPPARVQVKHRHRSVLDIDTWQAI